MRISLLIRFGLLVIIVVSFFSCKRNIEVFQTEPLSDYIPLNTGKYITYRLDSTVFTNFGGQTEIHSYQVKHVIESQITDNLGRPSYRVFRYLRDSAGAQPWIPAGSYFITPASDQIEVIEDNLRFVKMHLPITLGFEWKGNQYLGSEPYSSLYSFGNDDYMYTWEYHYENLTDTFKFNQQPLNNVVKVVQVDEKYILDTADVVGNKVTIRKNSDFTYLRGTATDTIIISASKPDFDHERFTIYNRTNYIASLNKILIPPNYSLSFDYYDDPAINQWSYPNIIKVVNNGVTVPSNKDLTYIWGPASDTIRVDVLSQLDTSQIKEIMIYNKSKFDAYCNFNASLNSISIPPNYGRWYKLTGGEWSVGALLDKDPYSSDLPIGSKNYSVEKYAKNIGLVFKELIMWDYQPNSNGKTGFGIKMWMIDHN